MALVGDGALTGGMAWEAVNNIAADKDRRVVIVVNDNGRSYAPTIGGLADQLAGLRRQLDKFRTRPAYEQTMDKLKGRLKDSGAIGQFAYKSLHATKKGFKDWWAPQGLFEDLGMKYLGPIDGHNQAAVEEALQQAKHFSGPVIVHVLTEKGRGYAPARADEADQFHAVGVIDPQTGEPLKKASARSWTSVFGEEIADIADERNDIVAITGAMLLPVGLKTMSERHPERVLDVGIAEQHAMTSAAGLAFGGLHPVVCVYATFLNRAFDQLLMDVALHKAGVTVVLDRAGVTGPDGPSHHGMWDMALMQIIPGVHLAAPRDAVRLCEELREAVAIKDAPTVVRFSKGEVGPEIVALERLHDGVEVLAKLGSGEERDVLIVSVGAMSELCLDVAQAERPGHHRHGRGSALGTAGAAFDHRAGRPPPHRCLHRGRRARRRRGFPDPPGNACGRCRHGPERGRPAHRFLAHGTRGEVMDRIGLSAAQIANDTLAQVLGTKVPFARPLPARTCPPDRSRSYEAGSGDPRRSSTRPRRCRCRRHRGGPRLEVRRTAPLGGPRLLPGQRCPRPLDLPTRGIAGFAPRPRPLGRHRCGVPGAAHRVLGRNVLRRPGRRGPAHLLGPLIPHRLAQAGPRGWEVNSVDMDLDVIESREHGVFLDDQDEFAEHSAQMAYPQELVAAIEHEAASLLDLVGSGQAPFDDTMTVWFTRGRAAYSDAPSR